MNLASFVGCVLGQHTWTEPEQGPQDKWWKECPRCGSIKRVPSEQHPREGEQDG